MARFRREGVMSTPVVFGSHRKPEGVVLPFELFEKLMPAIEGVLLAATIRERLANPAPSVPLEDLIDELGFSVSEFE
jgi:antitoxin StbD